ncbi:glycosyltransferase [Prevotella denticola]|uniref:glycosyltransferase n=1 Tax=Prevotella denticola TaxID=28129 RepID=UPI001C6038C5|nr:glycosyltransferase [Prevotella denticola]MBW4897931.1 glycosyltransferase [Prevotella denticola]
MNDLAVVIPAYKIDFFPSVLDSLSKQTCKRFTVYVGEDCSKSDFKTVIDSYRDKISIVYQRFAENLGRKDLVAQWERCIRMTRDEPWIWLFSDDDMIEENCVELFYKEVETSSTLYDIYHFDVDVINEQGKIIRATPTFPSVISAFNFYKKKQTAHIDSFVVEYIFSRKIYETVGGFENFALAWGSDTATWCKMGQSKGIKTLRGGKIQWRSSNQNITPKHDSAIIVQKLKEDIKFMSWASSFFERKSLKQFNKYSLFRLLVHYSPFVDRKQYDAIIRFADKSLQLGVCAAIYRHMFSFIRIGKWMKNTSKIVVK